MLSSCSYFSHSLSNSSPSKSGITLQFEVLFDLQLDLRLDLVLALLLSLLDAVADQEDIEHNHENDDKDEHLTTPEGIECRRHEVVHVPQRQLNVVFRVANGRTGPDMIGRADSLEDLIALELVSVRVTIDRQGWVQNGPEVIDDFPVTVEHSIIASPVSFGVETFFDALVDLVFGNADFTHNIIGTVIPKVMVRLHAHHLDTIKVVPEHVIVPLVIHLSNDLIDASLSQILSDQRVIGERRVHVGDFLSRWREAVPAIRDAVPFLDFIGAQGALKRDDTWNENGGLSQSMLVLVHAQGERSFDVKDAAVEERIAH